MVQSQWQPCCRRMTKRQVHIKGSRGSERKDAAESQTSDDSSQEHMVTIPTLPPCGCLLPREGLCGVESGAVSFLLCASFWLSIPPVMLLLDLEDHSALRQRLLSSRKLLVSYEYYIN